MISRIPILLLAASSIVLAEDWPQWRGPTRTGAVTDAAAIISKLPDDPKTTWKLAVGDGFASPVVAGGKCFYLDNQGTDEVAHAVDAATGKELWHEKIFSSHKDGFGIGPRTTPLVDGAHVYFQSAKGELQCRTVADGKLVWQKNFETDFGAVYIGEKGSAAGAVRHGATGAPLIDGDKLIAQVGGPEGAGVVAFHKLTGVVLWKSQNDQASYAAPILATVAGQKMFISFTVEGLIGLNPDDGKLLWRRAMTTRLGRHVTTPVIVDDVVIVSSHQLGTVGTRIVKEGAGFAAQEAWENKKVQTNFASPVVVDGKLYGLGSAKDLICMDPKNGEVLWAQTGVVNTTAEQAEATFLIMGKNILCLTDGGELALYAASPKAYEEISRIQVCGKNWCNPAYVSGKLYLRDKSELRCVELK